MRRHLIRGALRGDARVSSRATIYLASSVATTGISFVTLPLATRVLGPANYGVFALGTTIASFGATLAALGTTFFIGNQFVDATREERRVLISTLIARTAALAGAWAAAAVTVAWILRGDISLLSQVPLKGLALVLLGAVLNAPWVVAIDVLTIQGRAMLFSTSLVLQAIATATVILLCLYVFDLPGVALFVGNLAGNVVAMAIGLLVLRPYITIRHLTRWTRMGQRKFAPQALLEGLQPVVERSLLANYVGFSQLGNYSHSLAYRNLILQGTNGLSRAVWPVTLDEARGERLFPVTGRAWASAHLAVAIVGIPLVLFGDRLISALTNNKLTGASVFLAPWCVVVILQCTGKPATGLLYAAGEATSVARIGLLANSVVIVGLLVLVPPLGAPGAVIAVLLQVLSFRIALQVTARRVAKTPFQDWGAIFACTLITVLFMLRRYLVSGTEVLLVVLLVSELGCMLVGRSVLRATFDSLFRSTPDAPTDGVV